MPRGGYRHGAGRKPWGGKFGEETKAIRVPVVIADKIPEIIELINSQQFSSQNELLASLQDLLARWDAKTCCEDYSKNPRKRLARELWSELKSILD